MPPCSMRAPLRAIIFSIPRAALGRLPTPPATPPPPHTLPFSTSARARRNVLAKYLPPPRPARPVRNTDDASTTPSNTPGPTSSSVPASTPTFRTAATQPTASSFQAVPAPDQDEAVRTATPLPAMLPVGDAPEPPRDPATLRAPMTVCGVTVPPKPRPPGEEECCMSGCVHCVYTIYADELELYAAAVAEAHAALRAAGVPGDEWPDELRTGDSGNAAAAAAAAPEPVDPTMAAFLALESKIKKKQAPESSAAS